MKHILYIIFSPILLSCSNNLSNQNKPKIDYVYEDNVLKRKIIDYKNSSTPDTVIHYFENGQIDQVIEFRKGIENCFNGWATSYDSITFKRYRRNFYEDSILTKTIYYYPNGKIKEYIEGFNYERIGNTIVFDSLGNLSKYLLFDFDNLIAYKKEFPIRDNPKISFQQYYLISQFYFSSNGRVIDHKSPFYSNKLYYYNVVIPCPPDQKRQVVFLLKDGNSTVIFADTVKKIEGQINFPLYFFEEGQYYFEVHSQLSGNRYFEDWTDSLSYIINVIKN